MTLNISVIEGFVSKYRSLIFLGIAALFAELAYAILNLSAMPMYVEYVLDQGPILGLIISTFLLTEAVSRPVFGALGDRIGRKPLLIAGPAITAVTAYLTIKFHSPYILVGLRALDGLGSGALWPSAFATIGDIVEEKDRSAAMSVLNVTYMSGLALGFLMGGAVNELFHSYLASFYLVSILLILSVLVMVFFLPKKIVAHHNVPEKVPMELPGEPTEFKLSNMLRSFREVPDMIVLACVIFFGIGMLMPIVKLYAVQHLGLSEKNFGLVVAPIAAAMGLFSVPLGRLGDKYGKCVAVFWGLFACTAAMWVLALFKNLFSLHYYIVFAGISGIVLGLGFTIAFPAWMALVSSATSPNRRGEVLGSVGMVQGLAAIIGTSLGAYIYSSDLLSFPRLGILNYNVPFWISAILLSVGTVMTVTWVCGRNSDKDQGRNVTPRQKTMVIALAVAALLWFSTWIAYRYVRPVSPDRVAWSWVQFLGRGRVDKAIKSTVRHTDNWNGVEVSREKSKQYKKWDKQKAIYTVGNADIVSENRAEVPVTFMFPKKSGERIVKKEYIRLCRLSSGEWKVCGVNSGK